MSEAFIIEVNDEAAGIVVREAGEKGYRFHASNPLYVGLDGKYFSEPKDAERAVLARTPRRKAAAA